MATVMDIIQDAYTKVNGEYELVIEGSDDFNTYLSVLNQAVNEWVDTPYVKWQSLYQPDYTIGTVQNNVLVYEIPDFNLIQIGDTPFDNVYFIDSNGVVVDKYKIVSQAQFESSDSGSICMVVGGVLCLNDTPDTIVGATIRVPAYLRPDRYTKGNQDVTIDSTAWLIMYMSAILCDASPVPFIARNADNYRKQAMIFMKTMRSNNKHSQTAHVKKPGGSVIGSSWQDVMTRLTIQDL